MDDRDDRPDPLDPDEGRGPSQTGVIVGPFLGVIIGYVVFRLMPAGTSLVVALAVALVVIALVTYVSLEIGRRRNRRG